MFLTTQLTESELEKVRHQLIKKAQTAFDYVSGDLSHPDTLFLKRSRELPSGMHQATLGIGSMKLRGKKVRLVAKFLRKNSHSTRGHQAVISSNALNQEVASEFFKSQGFPVVIHQAVSLNHPKILATICENVASARKLEEAYHFNFSRLRNGEELKQRLDGYIKKMHELHEHGAVAVAGHLSHDGPEMAFRKTFRIAVNTKRKVGELLMADLDHVLIMEDKAKVLEPKIFKDHKKLQEEYFNAAYENTASKRFAPIKRKKLTTHKRIRTTN